MVVTFPNMGNVAIAAKTLCQALSIPFVMPEKNNKKTLELGAFHSPEEICLPFKLVLGNLISSIEQGADTVMFTGSCGPCRYGEYCELLMRILKKMGYGSVDFIVADLSSEVGLDGFLRRIGKISEASPLRPLEKLRALQLAYKTVDLCDKIDARAYELAGYEAVRGTCRQLLNEYKAKILQSNDPEETIRLLNMYRRKLDHIPVDHSKNPIRLAIIGEIFTIIEPFSNLYIEEKLMDYGVSTSRMLTPSWWLKNMMRKPLHLYARAAYKAADSYMPYAVGGHGKECVGEAVLAKEHGMDGAIQILPLGCMPEVIAKSILPAISREKDFPIMTLIVDEVTGEAGYVTRMEAFLDMLNSRKRKSGANETLRPASKAAAGFLPGLQKSKN